jgi:hypothetical protein
MNNVTLLTADLTTHVKIVAIALAAIIVAGLVEIGVQTSPGGSERLSHAPGHGVRPGN